MQLSQALIVFICITNVIVSMATGKPFCVYVINKYFINLISVALITLKHKFSTTAFNLFDTFK